MEAHVKDLRRFAGGWGFFAFDGTKAADLIGYDVACYSCHRIHAATDTTFVQFYPTLLPIARGTGHLSEAYMQHMSDTPGKTAKNRAAGR